MVDSTWYRVATHQQERDSTTPVAFTRSKNLRFDRFDYGETQDGLKLDVYAAVDLRIKISARYRVVLFAAFLQSREYRL